MRQRASSVALLTVFVLAAGHALRAGERPLVIAHRGASGYLPEHTLEAKAAAHAMGADYIEQDVVLSKDSHPVVLHDIHLDAVTNVREMFPSRARPDGRYYAADFMLAEIKRLRVTERVDWRTGKAIYPGRFPVGKSRFEVPTLEEEIELIQGLNKSTGRQAGLYPEIKMPAWHRRQGKDISKIVLKVLDHYGYRSKKDKIFLQCFDVEETKRIRGELKSSLRLVQLIGDSSGGDPPTDYDSLCTDDGLKEIAAYADAIGPSMSRVVRINDRGQPEVTSLVRQAHARGLAVHPYTLRADALPKYASDFDGLLRMFYIRAGVDGAFTDFPDRVVEFLRVNE